MKNLILLIVIIFSFSCSKDDEKPTIVYQEQNPLEGYLVGSGFYTITPHINDSNNFSQGFSFIPLVTGNITAITLKIPDTSSAVPVTIWNKATGLMLKKVLVDVPTANVQVAKFIETIKLTKGKEYVISFKSTDNYSHYKADLSPTVYPIPVADISITGFVSINGIFEGIPSYESLDAYIGDCSFNFIQTE